MKRIFLLYLSILFPFVSLYAMKIKIGIYRAYNVQKVEFSHGNGEYRIFGDSLFIDKLRANDRITISKIGTTVSMIKNGQVVGHYHKIYLRPTGKNYSLKIYPKSPAIRSREYNDGFIIFSGDKGLTLVNNVELDNYLMGVLESESGKGRPMNYYEAQAVISRTYALKHLHRHEEEGFSLCDRVHCQAYYHKLNYTTAIRTAVEATKGIYVVDSATGELIQGVFSANCGGETSSASYVWNKDIPYLKPFIDTFCIHTFQAKWQKKILKSKWKDFLINSYYFPIHDTYWKSKIYLFQQKHRKAFYLSPALGIPLRDIRLHFHLKSTFFSCHPVGDYVVLDGRGFGHGVGLCQEGAMNMAKQGYNYQEILAFYFTGIAFRQLFEDAYFNQTSDEDIKYK